MKIHLTHKRPIATDTYEFTFSVDERPLRFPAGQHGRIVLPQEFADERSSRKFSFVNPSHESDHVTVATRDSGSRYKKALKDLAPGEEAELINVKGDFTLPEERTRPLVFIAGGIGITPFMSMLYTLEREHQLEGVTMLYFNRNQDSAAYLADLQDLAARNPGFRFIPVMTNDASWAGVHGRLDQDMLREHLGDPQTYDFYVVGTPRLVDATNKTLRDAGVSEAHIFEEDFSGYAK